MFARILVPMDFTPKNKAALRVARDLARDHGSRVTLLDVVERIEHLPLQGLRGFYRRLEARAAKELARAGKRLGDAAEVHWEVLFGRRAAEIVRYATDLHVDLIVLSSHRVDPRTPGKGWAALSHQVALLAPCPVLLVK